ncbi:IS5 family transposase [Streptomyces sp. NPDC093111]|uniref:IS5 family transposase n=1 Tax=Streptomyces sp. NPDC093111 TaxID=3154978 RepID=UPI00343C28E8
MAESRCPPGGGGAGGEGLGRSRGGFTSKLHLSADGWCRPLSLLVTPGQRADCTQFKPVLEKIRVPRAGLGRPRKKPDSLAADKAYSNGLIREYLRRRGIRHTIPEKTDSQAAHLRQGARGGRPPGFDEDRYKKRNTVERAINRLKQSRAVGQSQALVLGDDPASTSFLPERGLFVRWCAAESEEELLGSVDAALANAAWEPEQLWDVPGPVVLFDSAWPGDESEPEHHLRVDLEPGRYSVRATYVEPNPETWLNLVQLRRLP